jgi:hypothetical protein
VILSGGKPNFDKTAFRVMRDGDQVIRPPETGHRQAMVEVVGAVRRPQLRTCAACREDVVNCRDPPLQSAKQQQGGQRLGGEMVDIGLDTPTTSGNS